MSDENKIRVILVKPGELSQVVEIDDSLESMQAVVGGLIQEIMPFEDDIALICNDEGKLMGLPANRAMRDPDGDIWDIICGDFFMCYAPIDSENFLSMPDDLLKKYDEKFKYPEKFFKTARGIKAVKFEPEKAIDEMEREER